MISKQRALTKLRGLPNPRPQIGLERRDSGESHLQMISPFYQNQVLSGMGKMVFLFIFKGIKSFKTARTCGKSQKVEGTLTGARKLFTRTGSDDSNNNKGGVDLFKTSYMPFFNPRRGF